MSLTSHVSQFAKNHVNHVKCDSLISPQGDIYESCLGLHALQSTINRNLSTGSIEGYVYAFAIGEAFGLLDDIFRCWIDDVVCTEFFGEISSLLGRL